MCLEKCLFKIAAKVYIVSYGIFGFKFTKLPLKIDVGDAGRKVSETLSTIHIVGLSLLFFGKVFFHNVCNANYLIRIASNPKVQKSAFYNNF